MPTYSSYVKAFLEECEPKPQGVVFFPENINAENLKTGILIPLAKKEDFIKIYPALIETIKNSNRDSNLFTTALKQTVLKQMSRWDQENTKRSWDPIFLHAQLKKPVQLTVKVVSIEFSPNHPIMKTEITGGTITAKQ